MPRGRPRSAKPPLTNAEMVAAAAAKRKAAGAVRRSVILTADNAAKARRLTDARGASFSGLVNDLIAEKDLPK